MRMSVGFWDITIMLFSLRLNIAFLLQNSELGLSLASTSPLGCYINFVDRRTHI